MKEKLIAVGVALAITLFCIFGMSKPAKAADGTEMQQFLLMRN